MDKQQAKYVPGSKFIIESENGYILCNTGIAGM